MILKLLQWHTVYAHDCIGWRHKGSRADPQEVLQVGVVSCDPTAGGRGAHLFAPPVYSSLVSSSSSSDSSLSTSAARSPRPRTLPARAAAGRRPAAPPSAAGKAPRVPKPAAPAAVPAAADGGAAP